MRIKTEERRQAIMEAAAEIFREEGYERASMAAISARLGGSKGTLYSYFKSKEELFAAVMLGANDARAEKMASMLDLPAHGEADPRAALEAFGRAYLDLMLSPDMLALVRIGIAEGGNGLGAILHERGPKRGWEIIAERLARWHDQGLLDAPDARVAALHLRGLLDTGIFEPRLHGAEPLVEVERGIRLAVDVFLRAYAAS